MEPDLGQLLSQNLRLLVVSVVFMHSVRSTVDAAIVLLVVMQWLVMKVMISSQGHAVCI